MLNGSILGALYRCWLSSGVLALLRRKMFFALVALYAVQNRNRGG